MMRVRISPDDVGRRVSVRSRIAAEHGGPRYTDTVGYLRDWRGGQLSIERRDRTMATLDERSVVAGRVVPPGSRSA